MGRPRKFRAAADRASDRFFDSAEGRALLDEMRAAGLAEHPAEGGEGLGEAPYGK